MLYGILFFTIFFLNLYLLLIL